MVEQAGGSALFLLVAIGLVVLAAFALLEAWLLLNGRKPITGYVREAISVHPHWSVLIVLVIGLLLGHFWR